MKILLLLISFIVFNLSKTGDQKAFIDPIDKVEESLDIIKDLNQLGKKGLPSNMVKKSEGMVIIPNIVKAGLIIGGKHGKGIAMIKDEQGNWSNPMLVKMSGGSIGWQIGVQKIELILVFRDRDTVTSIADGEFEIGADASATAGPVGRSASAGTNAKLEAEIYSYSKSKGLFAGISLDGSTLNMDEKRNEKFYEVKTVTADQIFNGVISNHKQVLNELKANLKQLEEQAAN